MTINDNFKAKYSLDTIKGICVLIIKYYDKDIVNKEKLCNYIKSIDDSIYDRIINNKSKTYFGEYWTYFTIYTILHDIDSLNLDACKEISEQI